MVSFHEIFSGLRQLGVDKQSPVIIHASLSSFGEVRGGAETLLGAVLGNFSALMVPTFTYKTMVIPEEGPASFKSRRPNRWRRNAIFRLPILRAWPTPARPP